MSDTARLLGLPVEWEFEGQTYRLGPRDLQTEGLFSRWVEEQALLAIQRDREHVTVAEYELALNARTRDIASQLYEWGELLCWRAAASVSGQKKLAELQLSKGTGLALKQARAIVEKAARSPQDWQMLLLRMREANGEGEPADPNPKSP